MTVLHSGSNQKFASGWENVFGGKKRKPAAKTAKPVKAAKKKVAKKK